MYELTSCIEVGRLGAEYGFLKEHSKPKLHIEPRATEIDCRCTYQMRTESKLLTNISGKTSWLKHFWRMKGLAVSFGHAGAAVIRKLITENNVASFMQKEFPSARAVKRIYCELPGLAYRANFINPVWLGACATDQSADIGMKVVQHG
jgi:hypothetical protein